MSSDDEDSFTSDAATSDDAMFMSADEEVDPSGSEEHVETDVTPIDPRNDPSARELEIISEEGLEGLQELKVILDKHSADGVNKNWRNQVLNAINIGESKPREVIGVVGATGAGKSSVINAVLEEEQVVPTSSMRACTASVTEISYNFGPHEYECDIQFVSRTSWEEQMRVLFCEIKEDYGDNFISTPNDNSDFGKACAKFKAAYGRPLKDIKGMSLEELMEDEEVTPTLGTVITVSEDDLTTFYNKVSKYVDSEDLTQTSQREKQNSSGTSTSIPVDSSRKHEREMWPLVEVVRLRLKTPALSTGLVIVDLPGVLDFNSARGSLAKQYIQQCSGLWIVAPITRAVDDHTAQTLLGESFKRQLQLDGGLGSLTFVCSKTDDINVSETVNALGLHGMKSDIDETICENKEAVKQLRKEIRSCKAKMKRVDLTFDGLFESALKLNDSPTPSPVKRKLASVISPSPQKRQNRERDEASDFRDDEENEFETTDPREEKEKLMKLMRQHQEEKTQLTGTIMSLETRTQAFKISNETINDKFKLQCIVGRNEYSKDHIKRDFIRGLQELDASREEDDKSAIITRDYTLLQKSLPVFCVSSKAYQKLRGRFQSESTTGGFLDVEDTEIPRLQRHCLKVGIDARKADRENFLNQLGQLVNSLKLQSSSIDPLQITNNQADDQRILHSKLEELRTTFNEITASLPTIYMDVLRQILFPQLGRASELAIAASTIASERLNKSQKEGGMGWGTYRAICRRGGEYRRYKAEEFNWNEELVKPLIDHIGPVWEETFVNKVPELLSKLCSDLQKALKSFNEEVTSRMKSITQQRKSAFDAQSKRYVNSMRNVFSELTKSSKKEQRSLNGTFIEAVIEVMRPAYKTAEEFRGSGSTKEMRETVSKHITQSKTKLFEENVDHVKSRLEEFVIKLGNDLDNKNREIYDSVSRDYMATLKDVQTAAEKAMKDEVSSFLKNTTYFKKLEEEEFGLNEDVADEHPDMGPAVKTEPDA